MPVHSVVRHEPHHTRLMRLLRRRILRVCAIGLTGVLGAACSTTVNLPAESRGADSSAVIGVDWHWQASRYNNDTAARPADPARYRLRVEPDGSLRVRVDCNQAGGRYRIDGSAISIEVTHSTRAACEPGSLDQAFLRDLGAAAIYFVRNGRLYLDLKNHTGTMEFARQCRESRVR